MAENRNRESFAREYLLRTLPPADATRLEEEYFTDDDVFAEVEIAEDELVDRYVRNTLSPTERELFEKSLLPSQRIQRRIAIAKTLAEKLSHPIVNATGRSTAPAEQSTAVPDEREEVPPTTQQTDQQWSWKALFWSNALLRRAAFATLALVVVVGSAGLVGDWLRIREKTKQLSASQAELTREKQNLIAEKDRQASDAKRLASELQEKEAENARLKAQLEAANQSALLLQIIPIPLSMGGSRSVGSEQVVKLPAEPAIFELRLLLEEKQYQRYSVVIKTVAERVVSGPQQLMAHGTMLRLRLLSTRLKPDDYVVTVSGIAPSGELVYVDDYTFRVASSRSK